ncbi:MAG: alanine--tRNA ligase [Bacteroidia bacterium]|nr:alanine--tRNA ligase [Bacteroidia bacterium]
MNSSEIREAFLKFFESKEHKRYPSAPIVVKNDPTLMFTNAGMNQFKDWFLGNEQPQYKRVANSQKCLRVSGKHNDLEEVGVDTYHHTMFEMLGNWSFGDYFKAEAIEWAWKLLTDVYGIDKDRLYVTVFEGDEQEGLGFDSEAYSNWEKWISKERILNGNKKDNFWEMGDTGPCGPCSEIHVDLRSSEERSAVDGATLVNNDHPQVIEIWNLVFMEFNRKADGTLVALPAKHVDTGMGFERLVRVIEAKNSNYDTDVFVPTIRVIEQKSGIKYGFSQSKQDIAMRVLSDHIRAISFAIADGQLPSNNGAGYVIRRILRRAVRYQYQFLGIKTPFLFELSGLIADNFKNVFPELQQQKDFVSKVIREEEQGFLKTIAHGMQILESKFAEGGTLIKGEDAFELSDTYGFPLDLTQLIARERGFEVDVKEFEVELQQQKERSRKATGLTSDDWQILGDDKPTVFVGYDCTESEITIIKYRKIKSKGKESFQMVFNQTPFYPEGGGQVGDTGVIQNANEKIEIVDTKKENNLIIHFANKLPENLQTPFTASVNIEKRHLTENNHSATHLLHAALRSVLGVHVQQKGSFVNSEYLRFDFSHFAAMTDEEIRKVERLVNDKIRKNIPLDEQRAVPIEEAKKMGATMLFGEKYGETVRVITFDKGYSRELCGGTHVKATGQIGYFKIIAETAVAAGVRRIEAITSKAVDALIEEWQNTVSILRDLLKSKDIVSSVEQNISERVELIKKIELFENEKTQELKQRLLNRMQSHNGVNVMIERVIVSNSEQLKNLSFQLRNEVENLFCVLGAEIDGKPLLSIMLSDSLVSERQLHAGNIVKELAKEIKGGGGGQSFYATAGGSAVGGLDSALKKANDFL